jgi:hypothetical protein
LYICNDRRKKKREKKMQAKVARGTAGVDLLGGSGSY